jgi:hypothetical protein
VAVSEEENHAPVLGTQQGIEALEVGAEGSLIIAPS